MKKGFLLIANICWLITAMGQSMPQQGVVNPTFENVIPPSPSAAAITKFGSIPVGQSTGIPSVSIPVYSYLNKGLGLSLPISLAYHAGGVRVNEKASNIGIGWALDAGGAITRVVRGIPDEIPQGFGFMTEPPGSVAASEALANDAPETVDRLADKYFSHTLDNASDIFSYNFNGHSGQFQFGHNHDILFIPQSKIRVEYIIDSAGAYGAFTSFIITDERGYKYVFADYETAETFSGDLGHNSNNAWYLSKILTPAGKDSITFSYNTQVQTNNVVGHTVTQTVAFPGNFPAGDGGGFSSINTTVKQLASIHFPDDVTATFIYDPTQRTDLQGDYWLDSIKVTDNVSGVQGVKLAHDYSLNRSTLTSVTPFGGTAQLPPYTMTYDIPPPLVPLTTASDAIDHWGFYNGNESGLIPEEDLPLGVSGPAQGIIYSVPNGHRNTDPDLVKAGSLKQINYPTGGYTTFEMEANQAFDNWLSQRDTVYQEVDSTGPFGDFFFLSSTDGPTAHPVPFTFPASGQALTVEVVAGAYADACIGSPCEIVVEIHNSSNGIVHTEHIPFDNENGADGPFTISDFPDGSYTIYTYCSNMNYGNDVQIIGTIHYGQVLYPVVNSNIQPWVGGLRVKKISDYSPESPNPVQTREYEYLMEDGLTSSGALGAYPVYSYTTTYDSRSEVTFKAPDFRDQAPDPESPNYVIRSSSTINDICYVNGSPVTYQRVTEILTNNGVSNGKTVRKFTSFTENPPAIVDVYPFVPPLFDTWVYGLLTKEQVYDASNNLLKETDNEYNYPFDQGYNNDPVRVENFRSVSIAPVLFRYEGESGTGTHLDHGHPDINAQPLYWRMSSYNPFTGRAELVKSTVTEYNSNGSVVNIDSTEYDQNFFYPKRKLAYNSKNQLVIHTISYTNDQVVGDTDPTGVYQQMMNHNMFNYPISEKVTRGMQPVTQDTNFYYNPSGTLFANNHVNVQVAGNPSETRLTYTAYDAHGNALSYVGPDGIAVSFIYDYKNQFPIAQVKNADSTSVAYTSFEADGTGNWTIAGGFYVTTASITGDQSYTLSSTPITKGGLNTARSYIVSYWTQGGPLSVNSVIGTAVLTKRGWTCYEHRIPAGATSVTIAGSGRILDELRLYPADAQMTTYTYHPLTGLTSMGGIDNTISYYEYDGFGRLLRVRDMDYNILKQYEYKYQAPTSCGAHCTILPLQTFLGTGTIGYPVGVFNIHGKLLGNATDDSGYVSSWNNDTADARIGTLARGGDALHFNLSLNTGQTAPAGVTGCRYYQVDLSWNIMDGVRNLNGEYVDFGDGTGMHLGKGLADTPAVLAPNTTFAVINDYFNFQGYCIHTYPDTSLKTIRIYHNDDKASADFDNANSPAVSLTKLINFRGNIPLHDSLFGGSCYQQSSMSTVANITNWNSITDISFFGPGSGDGGAHLFTNAGYAQDFMKNNRNLHWIAINSFGLGDPTFTISRLKSDWNTWFTQLQIIQITDDKWSHEDLSALVNLNVFQVAQGRNVTTPIDSLVIDNILIQIAAGAGQRVSNGNITIGSGGTTHTSASTPAVLQLLSKGWTVSINNITSTITAP